VDTALSISLVSTPIQLDNITITITNPPQNNHPCSDQPPLRGFRKGKFGSSRSSTSVILVLFSLLHFYFPSLFPSPLESPVITPDQLRHRLREGSPPPVHARLSILFAACMNSVPSCFVATLSLSFKSLLESESLPSLLCTTSVSVFGHTAPLVSE
jgi:hypothetical protein